MASTTTDPVSACLGAPEEKPEWLRIGDATARFGIGRSKIYELIEEGRLKSVSLRDRGKTKGIRLISYDSLTALIEEAAKHPTLKLAVNEMEAA